MTTVITDGNIVLADHRCGCNGPSFKGHVLGITVKESSTAYIDNQIKTILIDSDKLKIEATKGDKNTLITAITTSGDTDAKTFLAASLSTYQGPEIDFEKYKEMLRYVDYDIDCILSTTSGYYELMTVSNKKIDCYTYGIGEITVLGSGASISGGFAKTLKDKLTIEQYMVLACRFDECSSMSYSKYDCKTNVLIPYIEVTKDMVDDAIGALTAALANEAGIPKPLLFANV